MTTVSETLFTERQKKNTQNTKCQSSYVWARYAWLHGSWCQHVLVTINSKLGTITQVQDQIEQSSPVIHDKKSSVTFVDVLVPGFCNAHSHAFQYGLIGKTETQSSQEDNFWTWREPMYALASNLTPESLYDIACLCYREMLQAGYTSVLEFHYTHHGRKAREMAEALMLAAKDTGIRLILLPCLYQYSGFGKRNIHPNQALFYLSTDDYLQLINDVADLSNEHGMHYGIGYHSLRAVDIETIIELEQSLPSDLCRHIHISEQSSEVQQCLKATGHRPVEWLASHIDLKRSSWSFIHATYLSPEEQSLIRELPVNLVLCPTTEANLADGFFPFNLLTDLNQATLAVGSDSQVTINPADELRWLEYGARLQSNQRNKLACAEQPNWAEFLCHQVWQSIHRSSGFQIGQLQRHYGADFLALSLDCFDHPTQLMNYFFARGHQLPISHRWVHGKPHQIE